MKRVYIVMARVIDNEEDIIQSIYYDAEKAKKEAKEKQDNDPFGALEYWVTSLPIKDSKPIDN